MEISIYGIGLGRYDLSDPLCAICSVDRSVRSDRGDGSGTGSKGRSYQGIWMLRGDSYRQKETGRDRWCDSGTRFTGAGDWLYGCGRLDL